MAGAEAADGAVRNRLAVLRDPDQALAGVLDRLLDRERDLAGLAVADPDDGVLVADGDERGEREPATALDHLGDAVDLDHPLLQVEALGADRLDFVMGLHLRSVKVASSELQPALAGALGERLRRARGSDSRRGRRRRSRPRPALARSASSSPARFACSIELSLRRSGSIQLTAATVLPLRVVDQLGEQAPVGAEDGQARPLGGAGDLRPHAAAPAQSLLWLRRDAHLRLACRPCGGRARPRSGCPCPCRAPAGARGESATAISPTSCLSIPRTITWVGCGTSNSIPSGAGDRDRVRVADAQLERLALRASRGSRRPGSRAASRTRR